MATAYLITYGTDPADRLAAYRFPNSAAAQRAQLVPTGGCAYVVETPADVTLSSWVLLAVYNGLSGKPPVARFSDRQAGARRLLELLGTVAQDGPALPEPTKEKSVSDNETEAAKRGRASKYKPTDRIKVLAEENPRREGSKGNARFSLYRDGMTVENYLSAGGEMPGLIFDVNKKWVAVEAT